MFDSYKHRAVIIIDEMVRHYIACKVKLFKNAFEPGGM